MLTELDVLQIIIEKLEKNRIEYMISGSVAANIYGHARSTRDIDIILELHITQTNLFTSIFAQEFYVDNDMIRNAIHHQGMFNIIHNQALVKVDFIVKKDQPYRRLEFDRRVKKRLDGFEGFIVTLEDLILSKLVWSQEQESELQIRDVKILIEVNRDSLDLNYLIHWATELGVKVQLERILYDRS